MNFNFDNKTILIFGLVIGGVLSLYFNNENLASMIFGGLIGYLSKDIITVRHEDMGVESDGGADSESPRRDDR